MTKLSGYGLGGARPLADGSDDFHVNLQGPGANETEPLAPVWDHDTELHIAVRMLNGGDSVELTVIEARCFRQMTRGSGGLYDIPDFMTVNSSVLDKAPASPTSVRTTRTFKEDLQEEQNFGVEVFLRSSKAMVETDIHHTCLDVVSGVHHMSASGVEGVRFCPRWEEMVVLDVSKGNTDTQSLLSSPSLGSNLSQKNGNLDHLDMLYANDYQLCIMLSMNEKPIGELVLPVRSLQTHEAWYPMDPVDFSFSGRLRRVGRKDSSRKMKELPRKRRGPFYRKALSLRSVFLILVVCQIVTVIVTTSTLLYFSADGELQTSTDIVAAKTWEAVQGLLIAEFNGPKAMAVGTASFFGRTDISATTDAPILQYLLSAYLAAQSAAHLLRTSELFVGYPENTFYGVGMNFSDMIPGRPYTDMQLIRKHTSTGDMEGRYITPQCVGAVGPCTVVDYAAPIRWTDSFNVTARPWFVTTRLGPMWSPVYNYSSKELGVTCSYRVPQALSQPARALVAVDVKLEDLNALLGKIRYREGGYGVIFEVGTSLLIANSLGAAVYSDTGRLTLSQSENTKIAALGQYISRVCPNKSGGDQLQCAMETGEIKDGVNLIHTKGYIYAMGYYNELPTPLCVAVATANTPITRLFSSTLVISLAVSLLLVLVSVGIAVVVAHLVTWQLVACTKQLKRFAVLDFSKRISPEGLRSPIKEICRIYDALYSMRLALRSFSKYVPADVVKILVNSGLEATLGGQKKIVTVFFSDIVDFTKISEELELHQLMEILGEYLEQMSRLIQDNEGNIDKYIGDSIMALWNAPETVIDHPIKACEAALLSQTRLEVLQQDWVGQGYPWIQARIGIHTGQCIVGNFGARERLNYTAIGDNVNLASRLEALNKVYGTHILISEDTYKWVHKVFVCRPVDLVTVKGRRQPIFVYELIKHRDQATQSDIEGAERFAHALGLYFNQQFAAAARMFHTYLDHHNQNDRAAKMHLERAQQYMKDTPAPDWRMQRSPK